MPEPVILSWSGGKDSAMGLQALREDPAFEVVGLLTTVTDPYQRIAMHGVRETLLREQAASLGLPLDVVRLREFPDATLYETRMLEAMTMYRARGIRHVAFADLYLEDIRRYRDGLLRRAAMTGVYPVWGRNTREFAAEVIRRGVQAVLVCVDTEALPAEFAGRRYDEVLLAELPAAVDPCGENGEFHTFVYNGPEFPRPVAWRGGERVQRGRFAYFDLVPASSAD